MGYSCAGGNKILLCHKNKKPLPPWAAKYQYACKIQEAANGGRGRARGQAGQKKQIVVTRRFQEYGELDERKTVERVCKHGAQKIADEAKGTIKR